MKPLSNRLPALIAFALLSFTVAGCGTARFDQESRDVTSNAQHFAGVSSHALPLPDDAARLQGSAPQIEQLAAAQRNPVLMRKSASAFIGGKLEQALPTDQLPGVFQQGFQYHTDDTRRNRNVTLDNFASRVFNATGIPVLIHPDVGAVSVNGAAKSATGPDARPGFAPSDTSASSAPAPLLIDAVSLAHTGTLAACLSNVTNRLGLSWEYRNGTIVVMRFVTKSYEVAAFIGSSGYKVSSGSSTSQRQQNTAGFINLLSQQGSSVQHRGFPMIALNGQWARHSQTSSITYISKTTPGASSATGAGLPGIETDRVVTGDQYFRYQRPVLERKKDGFFVLLKFPHSTDYEQPPWFFLDACNDGFVMRRAHFVARHACEQHVFQ